MVGIAAPWDGCGRLLPSPAARGWALEGGLGAWCRRAVAGGAEAQLGTPPCLPGEGQKLLSLMFRESQYCHRDGHLGDVCPGQCRAPGGKRRLQRWLPVQLRSRCARGSRPSSPARRQWLCLPHGPWHPSPLAASLPAGLCCGPGGTLVVPRPRWLQDSCPQSCFRRSEKSSESWSVACGVPSTSVSTGAIGPRAGPAPRAGPEGFSLDFLSWE